MAAQRYLVLDTNAWLFHYGLGPRGTVAAVRALARTLQGHGYRLAYTSVTVREIRKSPRREVAAVRDAVLSHIHRHGAKVGAGYWKLVEAAKSAGAPPRKRNDAAIVLASEAPDKVWLGCDSWAAGFALQRSVNTIYVHPNL